MSFALRRALACVSLLVIVAGAGAQAADSADELQDPQRTAHDVRHEQGREIYNFRCYFCHGYSGDAKTLTATFVYPAPRDFTASTPQTLSRERMIAAVSEGRPGTAMTSFRRVLSEQEIGLVVDFVRREFMHARAPNTRYHTERNGWPDHERYAIAFPFATGELPIDGGWDDLTDEQVAGKRLFLSTCITCHDRARVEDEGAIWRKQSISYPRNNYSHTQIDVLSSASIYALHDVPPPASGLSPEELQGRSLWQQNCAFCHAADGTGQNWIGSFLEPPPRNLTSAEFMAGMTRARLKQRIRDGLPNTSMPAWRHVLSDPQIDSIIDYISRVFHPVATDTVRVQP